MDEQKQPEQGTEQTEAEDSRSITTIQERGPVLPLGIADSGGTLHQDVAVRPWRMKEERELGDLRDQHKDANLATYVGIVLATMCTRLGPHDFTGMDLVQKRLVISQMFMADVFFAYVWLRIQSLGAEFPITFQPSWSNKELKIKADLNTTEVKLAKDYESALWEYELNTPIKIRGKQVTAFKLGPQRWSALEQHDAVGSSANQGMAKSIIILASVVGCREIDGPVVLTEHEIDELSKLDLERLAFHIDEHTLGPRMAVEGVHKGRQFRAPIDWGYDGFFGISSV